MNVRREAPIELNAPVDKIECGVRANKSDRAPPLVDPNPLSPGAVLAGKYWVLKLLRVSRAGTLYDAVRDDVACARVTVKVLDPRLAEHEDRLADFLREAAIRHPNIVTILDFSCTPDGRPLLTMEPLRGQTLSAAIASDPPFSHERVAQITSQILGALDAAHAVGVLHRDLKPDSVFLVRSSSVDDVVKVLHFGFAKLIAPIAVPASTYSTPEQSRGEPLTRASDIYAVGCVMYETLTGHAPSLEEGSTPRMLDVRPELPAAFVAVVERAMARDPDARFATANGMAKALKRFTPLS